MYYYPTPTRKTILAQHMMLPPSQLAIATSSINRLLKEETSYEKELVNQQTRLSNLEANDSTNEDEAGNAEFRVRQEKRAIEETKAVFEPLREKIGAGVERVEGLLSSGASNDAKEVEAARDAVGRARGV